MGYLLVTSWRGDSSLINIEIIKLEQITAIDNSSMVDTLGRVISNLDNKETAVISEKKRKLDCITFDEKEDSTKCEC